MASGARMIEDSISPQGVRLSTLEVTLHRYVLAEFNTHRKFCLAGDSVLQFDLPAGTSGRANATRYRRIHTMTIGDFVDRWHHGAAPRRNKNDTGVNRQPIRSRLETMAIRQMNEASGLVQTSTVTDCWFSGEKPVYQVKAGKHFVAGSADHRVWTPDGYKTIGELRRGDEIVVQRKGKRDQDLNLDQFRKIGGQWRATWQRKQRVRLFKEYGGCQKCAQTEQLAIHHIIEVCVDPSLAFEESNILLLCRSCHTDQHRQQHWQAGQYLYGDTVIVDRVGRCGLEDTFDLEIAGEFPNFLANGVVVHNSRNSASSRAVPTATQVGKVQSDPALPLEWGSNKPGMQAGDELTGFERDTAIARWLDARDSTVLTVKNLAHIGLHKQVVNRLLEPFMWHVIIVSSTEWENFFKQRCSPLAQPEIRVAAEAMRTALQNSEPTPLQYGEWHTPFIQPEEHFIPEERKKISAARCARVSYLTHEGVRDPRADLDMYERLVEARPMHASPLEHVACPANTRQPKGNFDGWLQLREFVENAVW